MSLILKVRLHCSQSTGGCRSASSAGASAVTVASAGAGAGAGACAGRMASAGAQYRGGAQQWAAAYAPQPCRYPPPQPQQYAAAPSPYTPHQVSYTSTTNTSKKSNTSTSTHINIWKLLDNKNCHNYRVARFVFYLIWTSTTKRTPSFMRDSKWINSHIWHKFTYNGW